MARWLGMAVRRVVRVLRLCGNNAAASGLAAVCSSPTRAGPIAHQYEYLVVSRADTDCVRKSSGFPVRRGILTRHEARVFKTFTHKIRGALWSRQCRTTLFREYCLCRGPCGEDIQSWLLRIGS
ncbi:hypothetical protein BD414DRAFT_483058 [Trametes punicea]|nr:hypothetical protein BD414DRAFT_483058 [Trametes punicea]